VPWNLFNFIFSFLVLLNGDDDGRIKRQDSSRRWRGKER
jgi:hypothetical protein